VTTGRLLSGEIVVIDVGGGSSEFVVAGPSRGPIAAGIPLGSARLTTQFARHDPPSRGELEAMRREARALVTRAPDARPTEVIVVGGTASNVVRLVPGAVLDGAMTPKRVREAFAALRAAPAEEAASHFAVRVARARILPAGTAIVAAIMERYDVKRIRISDAGIREGTILALGHEGRAWRDRLVRVAQGWRR
jgi:exopolyphosphatase/guanosine-5'-triphosphate,3'-diphosphate pyrophosphatase